VQYGRVEPGQPDLFDHDDPQAIVRVLEALGGLLELGL
jgi:hypothetical protein